MSRQYLLCLVLFAACAAIITAAPKRLGPASQGEEEYTGRIARSYGLEKRQRRGGSKWSQGGSGNTMSQGGTGNTWSQGGSNNEMSQNGNGNTWSQGGTNNEINQNGNGNAWNQDGTGNEMSQNGNGNAWNQDGTNNEMGQNGNGNAWNLVGTGNEISQAGHGNEWNQGGTNNAWIVGAKDKKAIICQKERGHLSCPREMNRIHIISAVYGRSNMETCYDSSYDTSKWDVNCRDVNNNNADVVAGRCEGTRRCSFKANNRKFGNPCVGTLKYLEIQYQCY